MSLTASLVRSRPFLRRSVKHVDLRRVVLVASLLLAPPMLVACGGGGYAGYAGNGSGGSSAPAADGRAPATTIAAALIGAIYAPSGGSAR